jgi:ABC-type multidrug transport system fused ATPase/permease subunit
MVTIPNNQYYSSQLGASVESMRKFNSGLECSYKIFEDIDTETTIDLNSKAENSINKISKDIVFKNVSFRYTNGRNPSLSNVNMVIEHGKTTAFVGSSGAGKSTIIKLLEHFYLPTSGQILVNGVDLKTIDTRQYRNCVGYVGQEPALFNESIKENLLNAKPDATDDEIHSALKSANAYDFVMEMPEGINTNVGSVGSKLSGGQKQRIAIARALIKKPSLLILDEATSALDTKSEKEVQDAIEKINLEISITTVVIAHRLSTIANADKIIILKDGRVSQEVEFEELLSMKGLSYELNLDTKNIEGKFKSNSLSSDYNSKRLINLTIFI